jgi:hypothetical protein
MLRDSVRGISTSCRDEQASSLVLPGGQIALRAKRFPRHIKAQIFHPRKLILRTLLERVEVAALKFREIRGDRRERTPEKSFPCDSKGESFQRLKQFNAVIGIPQLCPADLFRQPSACLANGAFFGADFLNQIAQLLLISMNLVAQIAKKFPEAVLRMTRNQIVD